MVDGQSPDQPTLPPEQALRVESVCDRFEKDWQAGLRPRIEDYVHAVQSDDNVPVLRELVALEAELRQRDGEPVSAAGYQKRFPGLDSNWLDRIVMPVTPEPAELAVAVPGFEILDELGRGGMGVVYRARQVESNRIVALKMILARNYASAEELARFRREALAATLLAHPNIVKVYEVGVCTAGHYLVMEYIDGQTLDQIIRDRVVPVSWAVSLTIAVAQAVHCAHRQGVVHRDLKPGNIMIDRHLRPVVMDFSLAKLVGKASSLTRPGVAIGTPSYMPPEQAGQHPEEVGPRSDVYALGAVLYRMLAGRPPFEESSAWHTVLKVCSSEPPPPIRAVRRDVPKKLEHICLKCLRKRPADRYPSARALAKRLRQFPSTTSLRRSPRSHDSVRSVALVVSDNGKVIPLSTPITVIGRGGDCDVIVRVSEASKHHCRIVILRRHVLIEDLGSSNGTRVNGQLVKRHRLHDGDKVDIAGHVFTVKIPPHE